MATIRLPLDFKEFLKLLNSHQVEYLPVGGYAVGYHGYPRATGDMDLWVAVHQNNAERFANSISHDIGDALAQPGSFARCVITAKHWAVLSEG